VKIVYALNIELDMEDPVSSLKSGAFQDSRLKIEEGSCSARRNRDGVGGGGGGGGGWQWRGGVVGSVRPVGWRVADVVVSSLSIHRKGKQVKDSWKNPKL